MTGIRESRGAEPDVAPAVAGPAVTPGAISAGPVAAAGETAPVLPPASPSSSAGRVRKRRPRALTVVAVLGVVLFALWGIGGPLFGSSTLTPTDEMVTNGPWVSSGFAGTIPGNAYLDDVYTSELPSEILFKQQLGQGKVAQWNPYGAAGSALGAIPDYAFYSPLSVPFYVLPSWLAPAYERLLEIVCSVGGAFLFLRRVSLSRPAALLGGITFAGSGFMVAWLGFPQTRVAAFIPALFWTVERFLQTRRLRDAALAALPVAALLLGGFPSVAGYALLTAGAYAVVRLVSEHRRDLKRLVRPVLCLGGSVVAGLGLALFQLVPFLSFYKTWMIEGREQTPTSTLPVSSALTMVAPWSLGTVDEHDPVQFVLRTNMVEAVAYLGAAALVLLVVAFMLPRRGRGMMPTGAWVFFVAATAAWVELIYFGGPPLAWAQETPVLRALFEQNFVGRARSILGFLLAVLVAVGFEALLRARTRARADEKAAVSSSSSSPPLLSFRARLFAQRRLLWPAAVLVLAVVGTISMLVHGRNTVRIAAGTSQQDVTKALDLFGTEIRSALVLVGIAVACVIALAVAGRQALSGRREVSLLRFGAATTLIVLAAVQGAQFMARYYPKADKAMFYPVTDTHEYLADNLGEQRYASAYDAITFGTASAYNLRSVNGHNFLNANFAALMQGMPDGAVPYPTYIDFQAGDVKQATSPVLDRLGTKYWVAGPTDGVFGTVHAAPRSGTTQLVPGKPITVPITGPVRGIAFTPEGTVPWSIAGLTKDTTVDVVIRDASGKQIAETSRLTGAAAGTSFQVAVTADQVPAGTALTATITLHADLPLTIDATTGGRPAVDTITDADDGLRLAYVGSSVIYERMNALPRIRWASQSTVVPSQDQRVSMLATGKVAADEVVLSDPGPVASGQPASLSVLNDGTDSVTTTVDAKGSGYLVVADADQVGWQATVDGHRAALVKADQGFVAVNVPAGTHTVTLRYALPQQSVATWASAAVGLSLLAVPAGELWWERRRSPSGAAGAGPLPGDDGKGDGL
jgi:hypothetical protein